MGTKLRDSEKYAVLAAAYASEDMQSGTKLDHGDVGGYRTKTVTAGEYLYISCYPLIGYNTERKERQQMAQLEEDKNKKSKIRVRYNKYNNKRRIQEFEQIVHANFEKGDFHICCTYEGFDPDRPDEFEYRDREEALQDRRKFINRIKYLLKREGCDLSQFRWISCTVTKEGNQESINPLPDRHHHHILMHGVPEELRNKVEQLWKYGYCNADRLQDSDKGFSAMAGYIARQEGSFNGENPGKRSFSASKNIIRPTVKTATNKLSRRRASMIAADVRVAGKEIFEKLFEGYRLIEDANVIISTFTAGAYIYAKMRKMKNKKSYGMRC